MITYLKLLAYSALLGTSGIIFYIFIRIWIHGYFHAIEPNRVILSFELFQSFFLSVVGLFLLCRLFIAVARGK